MEGDNMTEYCINLCIFGEDGYGKTTLVAALDKVAEERYCGGYTYSFKEMDDPGEEDVLAQADVAVFVADAAAAFSEQSDELLSLAEELNVPHIVVFLNKAERQKSGEILEMIEMEAFEKLDEYGFEDRWVVRGSAAEALEDPNGEWGDKIMELLTVIEELLGI